MAKPISKESKPTHHNLGATTHKQADQAKNDLVERNED